MLNNVICAYAEKITVISALVDLIILGGFHFKTYRIIEQGFDKLLYYLLLFVGCSLIIFFEAKIINKHLNKKEISIENSSEYKSLLECIKTKEIELENISKMQTVVEEECLNARLDYCTISDNLKIKREELERFKDEVFSIVVSNLTETEDKPFTRVRTRDNLNNRN